MVFQRELSVRVSSQHLESEISFHIVGIYEAADQYGCVCNDFQGMLVFKTAFTLGANEKLFIFVYSFMMLEGIFPCKFPLTLRAAKVFLTRVKFFMFLPIA